MPLKYKSRLRACLHGASLCHTDVVAAIHLSIACDSVCVSTRVEQLPVVNCSTMHSILPLCL